MAIITGLEDQILVTFLFVLAVVFGALNLVNIFKSRAVNFVVALALGIFAVLNASFVTGLQSIIPSLTWFFVIVFLIAFVFELLGFRKRKDSHMEGMVVNGAVLLILFGVGTQIVQAFDFGLPFGGLSGLLFLVGLVLIISLFWGSMKIGTGQGGGSKE